eukprot:c24870_g2_i1 orf=345-731(+)
MTTLIGAGGVRAKVLHASTRLRAAGSKTVTPAKSKKAKPQTPVGPTVSKEIRAKTVLGANINKDGVDPPVKPDSEYPDWLWCLLDKQVPLSELKRRNPETMPINELQRFVKLDNRQRIKESNSLKSKG